MLATSFACIAARPMARRSGPGRCDRRGVRALRLERLPGSIVGLLWHAITPALDESIVLYAIAQYMNVQPLAPPLSFEEQWFRLLYEALGRIWGHA